MITILKKLVRKVWPKTPLPAPVVVFATDDPTFLARKQAKLAKFQHLLNAAPNTISTHFYDFLTDELRHQFNIVDTTNVSAHSYDGHALKMIEEFKHGFILDCGSGLRDFYYDNVINFEICDYPTTDVRGVAEQLPFQARSFDAVFSFNVLEHVKDPFAVANEIMRVLKPGGKLYAVVPLLQPVHAYPHHYYNMTAQGLKNLFESQLQIDHQEVNTGGMPIFMLTWILQRWLDGLPPAARTRFAKMTVRDLAANPMTLLNQPFVTELPTEYQFELAATTSLFGTKK